MSFDNDREDIWALGQPVVVTSDEVLVEWRGREGVVLDVDGREVRVRLEATSTRGAAVVWFLSSQIKPSHPKDREHHTGCRIYDHEDNDWQDCTCGVSARQSLRAKEAGRTDVGDAYAAGWNGAQGAIVEWLRTTYRVEDAHWDDPTTARYVSRVLADLIERGEWRK